MGIEQGLPKVNARYASPMEVAKTFVPPKAFDSLINPENSVLAGPRGSGKTSMFKMLQREALESWSYPEAEEYCARVDYVACLIPADPAWHAQLASIEVERSHPVSATEIADCAFKTHVLQSLIRTMRGRLGSEPPICRSVLRVSTNTKTRAELAHQLAEICGLSPPMATLGSLERSLSARVERLGAIAHSGTNSADLSFMRSDLIALVDQVIDICNDAASEPWRKWALLFDEIEVAPERVRDKLVGLFRQGNPRTFLKLSLFPFTPELTVVNLERSPQPGHDYTYINLASPRLRDNRDFALELTRSVLSAAGVRHSPEEYLGDPDFEPDPDLSGEGDDDPLELGAIELLDRARGRDSSLDVYLQRIGLVGRDGRVRLDTPQRRKNYRKIKALVAARDRFSGDLRSQSRRSLSPYTGLPTVLDFLESNPRSIVLFLRELIESAGDRPSREAQAAALEKVASNFAGLLAVVPASRLVLRHRRLHLIEVVTSIGETIRRLTIEEPFDADAVGSFYLGPDSDPALVEVARTGLNVGALVAVPAPESGTMPVTSLVGVRLRLSFTLAFRFRLPLRVGREIRLERLLTSAGIPLQGQASLFDEEGSR